MVSGHRELRAVAQDHAVVAGEPLGVFFGSVPVELADADGFGRIRWSDESAVGNLYDAAGNQTLVSPYTLTYDAENRITATTSSTNGSAFYGYDADGRRVTKSAGSERSTFYYDSFGNLAAEYGTLANVAAGVQYYTADHLNSTRLVTDGGGNVVARYDYMPFGENIGGGFDGRSSLFSSGAFPGDGITSKFTGKERDSGTGLDFFGARYMSSAQGRFTSPDPMLNSAKPWDPQSWNRYSYGLNNPLEFVDPHGLHSLVNTCADDDKKCNRQFDQNVANLKHGLTDIQKRVDRMKDGAEKDRLQTALGTIGTENDKNNVNVQFGPTGDGAAAQTNPFYNEQTGKPGFNMIFDPKHIMGGSSDWAIDAAHEGTHAADISDPRYNSPSITLSPFSLEYREYTTSAWAASAPGLPSPSYGNGRYQIWHPSWGLVDKSLTNYITNMKDAQGRQNHPETIHNPWGN